MVSIIGASSIIGKKLVKSLKPGDVSLLTYFNNKHGLPSSAHRLDVTDENTFKIVRGIKNQIVIVCADLKYSNQEMNHVNISLREINSFTKLIFLLHENYNFIVYLSSQAVFSSERPRPRITDLLQPNSSYGLCKLHVENFIRLNLKNYKIIRFAKVFDLTSTIIKKVIDKHDSKEKLLFRDDWMIAPISSIRASSKIIEIINKTARNNQKIIHICCGESISYLKFFQKLLTVFNMDSSKVSLENINNEPKRYFDLCLEDSALEVNLNDLTVKNCLEDLRNMKVMA